MNERRLNGRDVLAKTFPAKTKKGYDPVDVDAYLELVASQIDLLHGDVVAGGFDTAAPIVTGSPGDESSEIAALNAELEAVRAERDSLQLRLDEDLAALESARAENQQLRTQLTSVAPPPPMSGEMVTTNSVLEAEEVSAEIVAAPSQAVVVDDRAAQESYDLVLRAAQRSAAEAISEAHVRADEIVADANLTASRIAQESDRKAYEAATRAQGELATINTEIQAQSGVLADVSSQAEARRSELHQLGQAIISWAESGAEGIVDLRNEAPVQSEVEA